MTDEWLELWRDLAELLRRAADIIEQEVADESGD